MVVAIVFAHVWSVIQVIVLGSFARTIRVRTVFAAMAVGLYACVPLATLLQVTWTRLAAPMIGVAAYQLVRTASYTFDPFLEEFLKVLPLALLLMIPVIKRRWSMTDYVLIAAATGAGFGLGEDLYRYNASADRAQAIASGWAVALTRTYALIPGLGETLISWLPTGVSGAEDVSRINAHLAWSAIGGLAVALTVLKRTTAARATAVGLFLLIGLDHAAGNVVNVGTTWLALLAAPLALVARLRGVMPIAAFGVAWWLDRERQGASDAREPLLAAESSASSRIKGTLAAAVSRLPWSVIPVDRFVRMRRAYRVDRASAPAEADDLQPLIVKERDRVERELAKLQSDTPPLIPAGWTPDALRTAIRRPAVIVWLVILAPSFLWFVVGGWPQTAGLQAIMMGPIVSKLVFPISVLAQAWLVWRVVAGVRAWPRTRGLAIGDDAAVAGLRLACGVGAVALGGFSLMRILGGASPGSSLIASLHAADAASRATHQGGAAVADSAAAGAPPPSDNESRAENEGAAESDSSPEDQGAPERESAPDNESAAEEESAAENDSAPDSEGDPDKERAAENERATESEGAEDSDTSEDDAHSDDEEEPAESESAAERDRGDGESAPEDESVADSDTSEDDYHSDDEEEPAKAPAPRKTPAPKPDDAVQAQERATAADADAREAQRRSQQATRAEDAADIKRTTADPDDDPAVAAARARARQAHDAADKADINAADEVDDPWGQKGGKKAEADAARRDSKQADADQRAAEDDYARRQDEAVENAKAAAKQARENVNTADQHAADTQKVADQTAAAERRNTVEHSTDPQRVADAADAEYAAAQKRADDAFLKTGPESGKAYHDANEAARLAKERADAARAAANAAKPAPDVRTAQVTPTGWRDKP